MMDYGNFGPRLKRWAYSPYEADARLNFSIGAVRSGKTVATHIKIIAGCAHSEIGGRRILFGVSKKTVIENVLDDLLDGFERSDYCLRSYDGVLELLGCKWSIIGAKDEGSEKYLRGKTIGIAIGDEATLIPQSFFSMLVSRLSPPGARLYATTNADTPYHYLYTDYITNKELISKGDVRVTTFTMDDNPNLTEDYKQSMKRMYRGTFYDRFILGKWVMAEGAIYADALTNVDYYEVLPKRFTDNVGRCMRYIAIDYGAHNPTVFLDIYDDGRDVWVDNEYFWDSVTRQQAKSNAQYADDLVKFITAGYTHVSSVVVDPSAASFKVDMMQRGLVVEDANNDVNNGIAHVSNLMASGHVHVNKRCENFIREHNTYSWCPKKRRLGEEAPAKINDHTCDAFRYYCLTKFSPYRLEV